MPARTHRSRAALAAAAAVLALGALAACGSSGGSSAGAASSTTPTSTGSAASDVQKIDVTLVGSKVTPPPGKVKVAKGSTVELTVTRDTPGDIHVHGYDIEKPAQANVPLTITFVADQEGIFEVEAHDPDRQLLQLQVS